MNRCLGRWPTCSQATLFVRFLKWAGPAWATVRSYDKPPPNSTPSLTADQNIEFQQNLKALPISVVVLVANSNRLESLVPLVAGVLQALHTLQPRTLVRVGA